MNENKLKKKSIIMFSKIRQKNVKIKNNFTAKWKKSFLW